MKTLAQTIQVQSSKSIQTRASHLFQRWPSVAQWLRNASHLALFLDFDGTLTPLQRRPGEVRLDKPTRTVLCWLARQPEVTVWVISGRRLADLRKRVNFTGIGCVGLHGWERRGTVANSLSAKLILQARRLLQDGVRNLPKVFVEEKGPVSVVHYRGASVGVVRRASAVVHEVVRHLEPALRVLPGKNVWEVLPREFKGKGAAVKMLLAELPRGTLPVYIGDDITDESAFAALPRGITVRVGSPRLGEVPVFFPDAARLGPHKARFTKAAFILRNPREVREFLERVAKEIRRSSAAEKHGRA